MIRKATPALHLMVKHAVVVASLRTEIENHVITPVLFLEKPRHCRNIVSIA